MKEVKQKQHALTLPFLDAIFPSSESEVVLRPAQSSIPCYFSASTTLNYLAYSYHNKLWYSQELKHFTILAEGKEMSPRAKASGKYTFVPIQNHLTSWPTNHGQSGVLPNSEDRRAFTFSWFLLALYP